MSDQKIHSVRRWRDDPDMEAIYEDAQGDWVRYDDYEELFEQLEALDAWVSRMPDAGFNSDDPRWDWWHQRPRVSSPAKEPS